MDRRSHALSSSSFMSALFIVEKVNSSHGILTYGRWAVNEMFPVFFLESAGFLPESCRRRGPYIIQNAKFSHHTEMRKKTVFCAAAQRRREIHAVSILKLSFFNCTMEIHNIIWYNKPVLKKDMTDQMQDIMQNLTDFAAAMRVSGCTPKDGHWAGTVWI